MVSDELVLTLIWATPIGMLIAIGILYGADESYRRIREWRYHVKARKAADIEEKKYRKWREKNPTFQWHGPRSGSIDIPPWMRD